MRLTLPDARCKSSLESYACQLFIRNLFMTCDIFEAIRNGYPVTFSHRPSNRAEAFISLLEIYSQYFFRLNYGIWLRGEKIGREANSVMLDFELDGILLLLRFSFSSTNRWEIYYKAITIATSNNGNNKCAHGVSEMRYRL